MKQYLLSEYQSKIKTGDLLAFKTRKYGSFSSFFLWLYHKITKVDYSHVGIAMRLGDRLFIVEAIHPRVTITPLVKVKDFYLIPVDGIKTSDKAQIDFLLNFVEMPYSLKDMVTYYLGMDMGEKAIYCSELCSAFYYHVGFLHERDSGHTPQKLVNAILEKEPNEQPIHIVTDRGNL